MHIKSKHSGLQLIFMAVTVIPLSLSNAVMYALKNNLDAQISRLKINVSKQETLAQNSLFDPTGSMALNRTTEVEKTGSFFAEQTESQVLDFSGDFTKPFRTGDLIKVAFKSTRLKTNSFFYTVNPSHDAELSLNLEMPLFRANRKEVVTAPVRLAALDSEMSYEKYRASVIDLVKNVSDRYWQLLLAKKKLTAANQHYRVNKSLLEIIREKKKLGMTTSIDVIKSESLLLEAEEQLTRAVKRLETAQDELKILLNISGDDFFNNEFEPVTIPALPDTLPLLNPILKKAYTERPDIRQTNLLLKEQDIQLLVAEDNTRPDIKLLGEIGTNALGKDYPDMFSDLVDGRYYQANIGIQLKFPFTADAEKHTLEKQKYKRDELELTVDNLSQNILIDILINFRNLVISHKYYNTAVKRRLLADETYKREQERLIEGLTIPEKVMEAAEKMFQAEENLITAKTQYLMNISTLEQHSGIILNRWNIKLEPFLN